MNRTAGSKTRKTKQRDDLTLLWENLPEEVKAAVNALRDKKVEEIRVYDLREFTPFVDFVVLGTVFSSAQTRVAHTSVVAAVEELGLKLWGIEGDDDSGWVLVDFWDIVVHLFKPELRTYYNLEALWADFPWWPGE